MKNGLGKWEQFLLLKQNPLTTNCMPESKLYSLENLIYLLNKYEYIYVKHNSTGQGRAMYKVYKRKDGHYCFNGFTMQGEEISKCVAAIEDFHQVLHPYEKHGRLSGIYIIQEGVKSLTPDGDSISIRVHVQNLKGKWVIGGIYGRLATEDHGIVNSNRGSQAISIEELLSGYLMMDNTKKDQTIDTLKEESILASEVISSHFPNREYGIDFGINLEGKPILFEVNTTPSIRSFAKVDRAIWKNIVEIRKMQNEG
ncbi:YheC/YheD family protein [Lysinibacillus sp. JNUCC 51]|uniref:YheC/YheD family protein n=1 Tax=Lysinibacillus sp. JNUCC-51 TaxID=2792479 RepID=UPI0019374805|nr:YheC/YheD family protein [Lysinibacillus sp. JNUCC-51]